MLLLKQQTKAVNDRVEAKGCRRQWHGKGNHAPTVWSHHQRQRRDHWEQQVDSTATDDGRDTASLQPEGGWTHGVGPGAGRDRRSQTIAGGSLSGSRARHESTHFVVSSVTTHVVQFGYHMEAFRSIEQQLIPYTVMVARPRPPARSVSDPPRTMPAGSRPHGHARIAPMFLESTPVASTDANSDPSSACTTSPT